jgi:mevalonate pyrophosphate decarboxylase
LDTEHEDIHLVLGCIKKYLELLNELIHFLETYLSDNKYIKHFVLQSKSLLHEFKLNRSFESVIAEMKNNSNYMHKIIGTSSLTSFIKKFLAIIEIATAINKNEFCKVTYNDTESVYT